MTKGPNRLVLDQYLDTASEGALKGAGFDWKRKAKDLERLSTALKSAAQQAELRIGEQTLTGPALRAGMEESAESLALKSEQLRAAGEALTQVGRQLSDARDQRDALADLGEKPAVYQAPAGTPGVELTPEEIQAQADASQARANERSAWQSEYDQQEAKSRALTREMDAAFLGAIPPMKEIHGEKDPTEPPPNVPSGPNGPYLPGTQAPPVTGGGGGGGNTGGGLIGGGLVDDGNDGDGGGKHKPPPPVITPIVIECNLTPTPTTTTPTTTTPTTTTHVQTVGPTSTVTGSSQDGITYQPSGAQVPAPTGASAGSPGATAAAFGAAGGAAGMAAGAVRPGAAPSAAGSAPVRAIGSTGRAGSPGALSRSAAAGSSAGRGAATTGSAASRAAGSAARGTAAGSTAGRGAAGSRGAGGSTSGSRAGGRGASGARSAAVGSAGGRSGRKGERERTSDRDSLVYDQDWLGDDDVAPSVLD
ncbi:hypothetical protein [Nocardioides astragali]|uniref:PPE domain-containing protein n=1 Tax=Nocardioides astragali TaxID=1776736 RepID=A0ABW2N6W7_9ACTN|nr:hypothetical protein [Nocardioides astragali]